MSVMPSEIKLEMLIECTHEFKFVVTNNINKKKLIKLQDCTSVTSNPGYLVQKSVLFLPQHWN